MDAFHQRVNDFKRTAQRERIQKELRLLDANWLLWVIGGLSLLVLIAVLGAYFGNFHGALSSNSSDWSQFGSFVGGAAGPPLALLSVLGLLATIRQQSRTLARAVEQSRVEQHIRALEGFLADMQRIETMRMGQGGTFADVLAGYDFAPATDEQKDADANTEQPESDSDRHEARLQRAFRYYEQTLFRYAEMVAMHRENNEQHWDLRLYISRGQRALDSLQSFGRYLNPQFMAIIELNLEDGWKKYGRGDSSHEAKRCQGQF